MELDITRFFEDAEPANYSASAAELGDNAGRVTWSAAVADAGKWQLLTDESALDEFRRYVKTFGAWDGEEIAAWSADECNALLIQMVSGDIRETGMRLESWDWDEYELGVGAGRYGGRLFRGIDGGTYYYIGE